MLIDGIHVPLAVPFYRDGGLYLRKLEHNVRRYSLGPVHGLVALAPGGEASATSDAEAAEMLQAVGETAAREKVLVAGIERDSVYGALALAEVAEKAAFDALLVAAPRNWQNLIRSGDHSSLTLFFRSVADAAPLPVLLWSDNADGGFELPPNMIGDLASHSNITGICTTNLTVGRHAEIAAVVSQRREVEVTTLFAPVTRRMKRQQANGAATFVSADALGGGIAVATAPPLPSLKTRTKMVNFQIMAAGRTNSMVSLLEAGVAGAMPCLATCAPQACYEPFAAFKDGDLILAVEKAARLEAADTLTSELGIAAVKYGCDLNGYFGGLPRLPRLPLNANERSRVESALRELKN